MVALKVERDISLHHADIADYHCLHVFRIASLLVAFSGLAAVKGTKEVRILTEYESLGNNLILSKSPLAICKDNPKNEFKMQRNLVHDICNYNFKILLYYS